MKFRHKIISIVILVLAMVSILFLTNMDFFNKDYKAINIVDVRPYLSEGTLHRFAINDIKSGFTNVKIILKDDIVVEDIQIHYTKDVPDKYYQAEIKKTKKNSEGIVYYIADVSYIQSLYIDIKATEFVSIDVAREPLNFGIKRETILLWGTLLCIIVFICRKKTFFIDIYKDRSIIKMLLQNDLNSRYAGALLGSTWVYIQPIISIFVFWFVFQMGFKSSSVSSLPFIVWFMPAYIAWMYFQDVISYSASCLREYSYLVNKIKFKTNIIPVIKVLSAIRIQLCFIVVAFAIMAIYGLRPGVKCFQLFYYIIAMIYLLTGLSWGVSALSAFMKDITPIINILLQLGYFSIPVFWTEDMLNPTVIKVLKLNPIYYIVQGYRDSLCNGQWFWENLNYLTYYWVLSTVVFCVGVWLFDGTKKHFSDLL